MIRIYVIFFFLQILSRVAFAVYTLQLQPLNYKHDRVFFVRFMGQESFVRTRRKRFDFRFFEIPPARSTHESRPRDVYREIRYYIIIIAVRCSSERNIIEIKRRVSAANFKRIQHVPNTRTRRHVRRV